MGGWVIIAPFAVARYPMMTDLPFHAANASIVSNYFNPDWHFREQFVLQPFAVPYMSFYVLTAVLMYLLPPIVALKVAAAIMLALLPVGLAMMFHGMRKSPLLGLLGLGFVWCDLTHWGFINHMAALGLFAMVIGLTLRALERPSRRLQLGLGAALIAVFFTHVFRFPFAIAAVIGTAIIMYPATRRWRPILVPTLVAISVFALWWIRRPTALGGDLGSLGFDWSRLAPGLLFKFLFNSFNDVEQGQAATRAWLLLRWVAAIGVSLFLLRQRWRYLRFRHWAWGVGVTLVPLFCAAVFLTLYLIMPQQIGIWWYVFPRELTSAVFIALGALPDLPRAGPLRVGFVLVIALAVVPLTRVTMNNYAKFHQATDDFHQVIQKIPVAPKLLYLVRSHHGSTATRTPFIHLPAYVQATHGGWLSFHFSVWGASPVAYRPRDEPGAVVPPEVPLRWEWKPYLFRVCQHGRFFDWFLIRSPRSPAYLFRWDRSIHFVAHEGTWWLYQRKGPTKCLTSRGGRRLW